MEFKEFSGKTVEEAVSAALQEFKITTEELEYHVVDEGSAGFLGFNKKPAVIKAKKKETLIDKTKIYMNALFGAMNIDTEIDLKYNEEDRTMDIDLSGPEMGILIGKRGQTLDALQYLISLYVNKESTEYIRVKLDTENYRARRKETLEQLAKNIAIKVKRYRKPMSLEPMNPYERRIIHSALQNDRYVTTRSEGDEPNRHIIVELKRYNKKKY
ncbi:MAG: protein jag [Lachnospiraceae bacterium]|nr:protein jag [Lachnospiraceae bacterium]